MPIVLGLAARMYGLSVRELLGAATLNAAWTLDLHHDRGSIEVGKRADLLVLDGPAERIPYRFGHNPVQVALIGGAVAYVRDEAAAERISDG
jgi:imidazolonepropionase